MASGVFLWVRLVVSSLISGFRRGDDITDLQVRLRALPSGLERLFKHMLSKMEPMYQRQAAEYFQLIRLGREIFTDSPLRALDLSFAQTSSTSCLDAPVGSIAASIAVEKCTILQKRLRSRCCGLIELHSSDDSRALGFPELLNDVDLSATSQLSQANRDILSSTVEYLHRTVAEYIYRYDVWKETLHATEATSFDAFMSWSHATLRMLKALSPHAFDGGWELVQRLIKCERQIKRNSDSRSIKIFDELDRTMEFHFPKKRYAYNYWTGGLVDRSNGDYRVCSTALNLGYYFPIQDATTIFFSFMMCLGFYDYVERKLQNGNLGSLGLTSPFALTYTLYLDLSYPWNPTMMARLRTLDGSNLADDWRALVAICLKAGADPQAAFVSFRNGEKQKVVARDLILSAFRKTGVIAIQQYTMHAIGIDGEPFEDSDDLTIVAWVERLEALLKDLAHADVAMT
jgi:hypothetical protein